MSICSYIDLSDIELMRRCRAYGKSALEARQKFLAMLPEVQKRRLYINEGFASIFHFAAVVGGVSEELVSRVLGLDERFKETPLVHNLLTTGVVSAGKLARIASVVTPENEIFWSEKVQILPQSALETLVRDARVAQNGDAPHGDDNDELLLTTEAREKLLELQRRGIDVSALIIKLLQHREVTLRQTKEELAEKYSRATSRAIPVAIKNILAEEYGTKCSLEYCKNRAEQVHHTQRFSLGQSHNPFFLAPLCKPHHTIAHSIDLRVQEKRRSRELVMDSG